MVLMRWYKSNMTDDHDDYYEKSLFNAKCINNNFIRFYLCQVSYMHLVFIIFSFNVAINVKTNQNLYNIHIFCKKETCGMYHWALEFWLIFVYLHKRTTRVQFINIMEFLCLVLSSSWLKAWRFWCHGKTFCCKISFFAVINLSFHKIHIFMCYIA